MLKKTFNHHGQPIAHVYFHKLKANGVSFLTPSSYTLQLGLIQHPKGKVVREHIHNQAIKYNVDTTQEFLFIEKGLVRISLYGYNWEKLGRVTLTKGDFVLFVGGGHGIEVLKACRILEIKQGPYPGDKMAKIYRDENHKYSGK